MESQKTRLANISFILTQNCNFKCSYCTQGKNQDNKTVLSFKMFKLILMSILKESEKSKITHITLTLMGGELSTDKKYLEYFKYVSEAEKKFSGQIQVNFLSNFSGSLDFFEELIKYQIKNLDIVITLHDEYFTPDKLITKIELLNKRLENFSENSHRFLTLKILKSEYMYLKKYCDVNNIEFEFEEMRAPGPIIGNTSLKKCNALYYMINEFGKIIDSCRNKQFNFLSFKFDLKEILCSKKCSCPFLETEFKAKLLK